MKGLSWLGGQAGKGMTFSIIFEELGMLHSFVLRDLPMNLTNCELTHPREKQ